MVSPTEAARLALASLAMHKLRSALTLLGLIISVTSLIVVMTLVQGANTYVQEKIANLGTNVFEVAKTPLVMTNFDEMIEALKHKDITRQQWRAVAEGCRTCVEVGAVGSTSGRVRSSTQSLADIQIRGESAEMARITTLDLSVGRWFHHHRRPTGRAGGVAGLRGAGRTLPAGGPAAAERADCRRGVPHHRRGGRNRLGFSARSKTTLSSYR